MNRILCHRKMFAMLVLLWAAYGYLHGAYRPFDLSTQSWPFDEDHGTLADIPADVRALDGRRVEIHGFMIPMDRAEKITKFGLVPTQFDRPASTILTQTVVAHSNVSLDYCPNELSVFGRLRVRPVMEDGFILCLYEMEADRVAVIVPPTAPPARWPWAVIGGGGLAGVSLIRRAAYRRGRRHRAGCCVRCGYDLRATPTRCPECGSTP